MSGLVPCNPNPSSSPWNVVFTKQSRRVRRLAHVYGREEVVIGWHRRHTNSIKSKAKLKSVKSELGEYFWLTWNLKNGKNERKPFLNKNPHTGNAPVLPFRGYILPLHHVSIPQTWKKSFSSAYGLVLLSLHYRQATLRHVGWLDLSYYITNGWRRPSSGPVRSPPTRHIFPHDPTGDSLGVILPVRPRHLRSHNEAVKEDWNNSPD